MPSISIPALTASLATLGGATAATGAITGGAAVTAGLGGIAGTLATTAPLITAGAAASGAGILGTAGLGLSALGGVTGVIGQLQAGKAQAASARYNSDVAAQNAKQADLNAQMVGEAGAAKAAMVERDTRAQVGGIKSQQAANGIDVMSGSALDVRSSAAELGELDALTVRSNAAKEAYGYQVQSVGDKAQSQLGEFEAKNDETAGEVNAASTFLGAAGSGASNYYKYQMAGGFG